MIATLEREITGIVAAACTACGTALVTTMDAIGRTRERCPRCDGISRRRQHHPDDAMLPQGLVALAALPRVAPGQLRCQRCAVGVEGSVRFCAACEASRADERRAQVVCRACRATFRRTLAHRDYCPVCAADPRYAADARGQRARNANSRPLQLADKACADCGAAFTPTGCRSRYCPGCGRKRREAYRRTRAEARL